MWDSDKRNEWDKEAIVSHTEERCLDPYQQFGYHQGSLSIIWKQASSLKVFTMNSGYFNPLRWFIQVPDIHGLSLETAAEGMFGYSE